MIKRQDGFTIVEALVSVGLAVVVALSLTQITGQLVKTSKKMTFFEDSEKLTKEIQALLSNQKTCTLEFTSSSSQQLIYDDSTDLSTTGKNIKICPLNLKSSYIDVSYKSKIYLDCSNAKNIYKPKYVKGNAKIEEIKIKHEKFTGFSRHNLNDKNNPTKRFSSLNLASVLVTFSDTENPTFRVTKTFPIILEADPENFDVLGCYSGATSNLQSGLGEQACGAYQTVFNDPKLVPPLENYIIYYGYNPDTNDCEMINPPPSRPAVPAKPPTHGNLLCTGSNEDTAKCPVGTGWISGCQAILPPNTVLPPFDLGGGFGGTSFVSDCTINTSGKYASCRWATTLPGPNVCKAVCTIPLDTIDAVKAGNPNCENY